MQPLESIDLSARAIFGLSSLALMAVIILMIRRHAIKEKYALLWLPLGAGFFLISLFPEILLKLSARIQLHYITVVLLGVIVLFTTILLYFTARLSQLREDVKKLAQEVALADARERDRTADARERELPSPEKPESRGWLPAADSPLPAASPELPRIPDHNP